MQQPQRDVAQPGRDAPTQPQPQQQQPQQLRDVAQYQAWDFGVLYFALKRAAAALTTDNSDETSNGPMFVLLTTGAMNPIHRGHVEMLHAAARQLRDAGRGSVVAAFISPSHDAYLAGKFGTGKFLPAATRLAAAAAALRGDPLVRVGAWEAQQRGHWPDFPRVCRALEDDIAAHTAALVAASELSEEIAARITKRLRVLYVCGTDHYAKCGLRHGVSSTVGVCVVARRNDEPSPTSPSPHSTGVVGHQVDDVMTGADPRRVFFVESPSDSASYSSTKVRAALSELRRMLHPDVAKLLLATTDATA